MCMRQYISRKNVLALIMRSRQGVFEKNALLSVPEESFESAQRNTLAMTICLANIPRQRERCPEEPVRLLSKKGMREKFVIN